MVTLAAGCTADDFSGGFSGEAVEQAKLPNMMINNASKIR
jgi:hypothetical protein